MIDEIDLLTLKGNIDKFVKIICLDGETLIAEVLSVSDEYQDVIVDIYSTNRPDKYEKRGLQGPAYTIEFSDIVSIETVPDIDENSVTGKDHGKIL